MLALHLGQRARFLPVAVFTAVAIFAFAVPAKADDHAASAKRSTTSLGSGLNTGSSSTQLNSGPSTNGFLYFPGAQPGMNIGGRVNVGKSHVYVPYYGNISNDPAHPGVQGTTGLAYGFRTWDISVLNGGFGNTQTEVPGLAPPKVNPALSLSIRF